MGIRSLLRRILKQDTEALGPIPTAYHDTAAERRILTGAVGERDADDQAARLAGDTPRDIERLGK